MDKSVKRNKGKSLLAFPGNYCVIDIETTGLDPSYDSIIEIAAIKVIDGVISNKFSSLVKPDSYYCWFEDDDYSDEDDEFFNDLITIDGEKIYYVDSFIRNLTGITNHMLENAPSTTDVLNQFKDFAGNSILIGHNVNFDINFLYDNFIRLEHTLNNDFVDTLRLSKYLLPDLKNHKLKSISEHFGIEYKNAHRAIADCEITNQCLTCLKDAAISEYGSIDEFIISTKKHSSSNYLDLKSITPQTQDFDITHPLYNKECVFTGTLEKFTRKEAAQIVVDHGGTCGNSITKNTDYLILGATDYSKVKGGKSSKLKKAETLKLKGCSIEILSENVFYDMIYDC